MKWFFVIMAILIPPLGILFLILAGIAEKAE